MSDWDDEGDVKTEMPPVYYTDPSSSNDTFNTRSFSRGGGGREGRGGRGRNDRFSDGNRNRDDKDRFNSGRDKGFGGGGRNRDDRFGGSNRGSSGGNWRDDTRNGGGGNRAPQRDSGESEVIKVPSRMIGKIIGRGGQQIESLQVRSSAKIQVTKETDGDDTIIKIIGSKECVDRAKELIEELTSETNDRRVTRERSNNYNQGQQNNSASQSQWHQSSAPQQSQGFAPQNNPPAPGENFNWLDFVKQCDKLQDAEWNKLPPIIKQFYIEHPEVTSMTEDVVARFREENNNIVVDRTFKKEESIPIPKPVVTFYHAFHNYPEILEEIRKAGFESPSPIQSQAWPVLLSGEDLIGIAQTGTGKTLAFLLPAMIHIDGQTMPREERGGPAVLIMAPTRELALQIDKEIKKYQYRGITSVCVYGGGDRRAQVKVVTEGVDIVIATPGRMNDLCEAGHLNVKSVTYVVLDEADRMLDMGFEPQIRKVMYSIRPTRQTIMTSATWPPGVRRLAQSYMNDPIQVYVGSLDLAAVHTVTQVVQIIEEDDKEEMFYDFARNLGPDEKMIVFCGTKARADQLSVDLSLKNIPCAAIHGDRDQSDREQAIVDIGDGTVRILIATDVASRGLDIDDITHVVNYDFPRNIEEYVHRVGRTGRAGKSGESISYFTRKDWAQASELIKILEEAQQYVPEELHQMQERFEAMKERREREGVAFGGRGGGRGGGGRGGGGRGGRRFDGGGGGRRW